MGKSAHPPSPERQKTLKIPKPRLLQTLLVLLRAGAVGSIGRELRSIGGSGVVGRRTIYIATILRPLLCPSAVNQPQTSSPRAAESLGLRLGVRAS